MKKKLKENSKEILTGLREHGEHWHREIKTVVNKLEVKLKSNVSSQKSYLKKNKKEFKHTITQMEQRMAFLEKICETKDDKSVLAYESANAEFKKCLPKFKVSLSWFCNQTIKREQLKKTVRILKGRTVHNNRNKKPNGFCRCQSVSQMSSY